MSASNNLIVIIYLTEDPYGNQSHTTPPSCAKSWQACTTVCPFSGGRVPRSSDPAPRSLPTLSNILSKYYEPIGLASPRRGPAPPSCCHALMSRGLVCTRRSACAGRDSVAAGRIKLRAQEKVGRIRFQRKLCLGMGKLC